MSTPPAQQVTDRDILDAVRASADAESVPVATTSEVAERVDLSQTAVRIRLNELAEEGDVKHGKVGQASVFYLEDPAEGILPPDLDEFVDEYAEKNEVSKYDALRELTETGLQFSLTESQVGESVEDNAVGFALGLVTAGAVVVGILATFGSVILGWSEIARNAAVVTVVGGVLGAVINRSFTFLNQRGYLDRFKQ